jgi:hypothetical protein
MNEPWKANPIGLAVLPFSIISATASLAWIFLGIKAGVQQASHAPRFPEPWETSNEVIAVSLMLCILAGLIGFFLHKRKSLSGAGTIISSVALVVFLQLTVD